MLFWKEEKNHMHAYSQNTATEELELRTIWKSAELQGGVKATSP